MSYTYGLVGVDNVQSLTLSNIITDNLVKFIDYGFVDKGGFVNVEIPSSGMYGGDKHKLRLVDDTAYTSGRTWESFRKNWVYESGLDRSTAPLQISGIYKGSQFLPYSYNAGSGYYVGSGYRLDYTNGRVIFNSPIPATSVVSMEYSYKWLHVEKAEGVPFFRQIQQRSFRLDENYFSSSGNWAQIGPTRVQLPAAFVESPIRVTYKPYQLGGGQWANTDVTIHVIAENFASCTDILNILSYQNDRNIILYDSNGVYNSGDFALNYRGDLVDNSKDYKYLVDNYHFGQCRMYDATVGNPIELNYSLYMGTVTFSAEIPLGRI